MISLREILIILGSLLKEGFLSQNKIKGRILLDNEWNKWEENWGIDIKRR